MDEQTQGDERPPLPTCKLRLRRVYNDRDCKTPLMSPSWPECGDSMFALEQLHVMPGGDTVWLELDVEEPS